MASIPDYINMQLAGLLLTPLLNLRSYINVKIPQRVILCSFGFGAVINMHLMRYLGDVVLQKHLLSSSAELKVPQGSFNPSTMKQHSKGKPSPIRKLVTARSQSKVAPFKTAGITKRNPKNSHGVTVSPPTAPPKESTSLTLIVFYMGYALTHVPGAMLAERYGGKNVLAVAVTLTVLCTVFSPFLIESGGPYSTIFIRLLAGLCQGPTYPALCALLAEWVPVNERGSLAGLVMGGCEFAMFLLTGFFSLVNSNDFDVKWPIYAIGTESLLWVLSFSLVCFSEPSNDPYLKEDEKSYLQTEIRGRSSRLNTIASASSFMAVTPWRSIFSNMPIWALLTAAVQHDWDEVQQYHEVTHASEGSQPGFGASLSYLLKWLVTLASGVLSDALISFGICSTTATRRIIGSIAAFGFATSSNYFGDLCCSLGTYYASVFLTPLDMSPNHASIIMAIVNGVGSISGSLALCFQNLNLPWTFPNLNGLKSAVWLVCSVLISGEIQDFNDGFRNSEDGEEHIDT